LQGVSLKQNEQLSCEMKFKFQLDFELQYSEVKWIGIWFESIEASKPLEKNLDNSSKPTLTSSS
jgi:hypothetical protein